MHLARFFSFISDAIKLCGGLGRPVRQVNRAFSRTFSFGISSVLQTKYLSGL